MRLQSVLDHPKSLRVGSAPSRVALSTEPEAFAVLSDLWRSAGEDPAALQWAKLTGSDPVFPSDFKVATAATASIAAAGLAATELWRLRTGRH